MMTILITSPNLIISQSILKWMIWTWCGIHLRREDWRIKVVVTRVIAGWSFSGDEIVMVRRRERWHCAGGGGSRRWRGRQRASVGGEVACQRAQNNKILLEVYELFQLKMEHINYIHIYTGKHIHALCVNHKPG